MDDDYFNVPLRDVKRELRHGYVECQKRGLIHSAKWLAEMAHGLAEVDCDTGGVNVMDTWMNGIDIGEYDSYALAKSYFDVREYDRAAYFVRNCESPVPRFLHFYSLYMAQDKRRLDSITEQSNLSESTIHMKELTDLLSSLRSEHTAGRLDGYGLYLYGIVLKAVNLNDLASQILEQSLRATPTLWAAVYELAPLVTSKEKLMAISLNGHWMRFFFVAYTLIELYLSDEGLKAYEELQAAGFKNCTHIISQMALVYHNKRDVDKAIEIFQELQEADPHRLDQLDIYSNMLFVKELKTEMAQLAHIAVGINKYRPETCCVIGNYYSIRCDHPMAITYFQRALKLNPKYLAAWTLMGHEFMEMKNTNAAIQSYRKAVEVNKRDYRAWYGLGQSYEILKMHYYSLYYFKVAHQLRPYDSRMLVALGETYEKLDKNENAIKCYRKACDVGDIEGIAMYKLANLHEKLGQFDEAVHYYVLYCEDERAAADKQSLYHGFMTLANYYESVEEFERASHYAYKCLESEERKAEAKALLKTIENKRVQKPLIREPGTDANPEDGAATAGLAAFGGGDGGGGVGGFDEDMDLELSDSEADFPSRTPSTSLFRFKPGTSITTPRPGRRSATLSTIDDMNLSGGVANTSSAAAATPTSTSHRTRPVRSAATQAVGAQQIEEEDEMDVISID